MSERTIAVESCIRRLNAGDPGVRDELIALAFDRLQRMAKKMKNDFDRLGRWEQTDDILQNASVRLLEALNHVELVDARHFYRLAALQIRRELIDLCRHYHGPLGLGANHHTQKRIVSADQSAPPPAFEMAEMSADPQKMQEWGEFHQLVEELPEKQREVFDLLWYHELSQEEAAQIVGVSTRQVKRIWRAAKLTLHEKLNGDTPEE